MKIPTRATKRWDTIFHGNPTGQNGVPVPSEQLEKVGARFDRTLENLHRAIRELPFVQIFDNGDLRHPFHKVAECENGKAVMVSKPVPAWLKLL